MANKMKKILSVVLSVLMVFSAVSVAAAADTSNVSVEIISFMRGTQTDLRSSELLEAHVEGYDGNVRELTYKWKSTLGTYLYVYNSHNMYNINNTDGEIEIHNTSKNLSGLPNMVGRTYDKEFSGKGFAWASVYGANIGNTSLQGTVTVEVYDVNGNLLCSDSHTGTGYGNNRKGFVAYNLDKDMDNVVIGLFEGDKRNVKDLLGESAVVHITCTASTVENGRITSGADHIKLTKESGDYYITGTVAGASEASTGDAQVDLDIKKGNCKFHNGTSGDAITTVFVFKKPTTETTTTTLTLTGNLDDRCDYFIGGVEGTKQNDGTIIFEGLTPNTSYTVEVRGEYKDKNDATKYAYAYVYDTTKPVYKATVNTYLDGKLTDISEIHGDDVTLYLHEDKENAEYIELIKSGTGKYTAAVTNGIYFPWHIEAGDHYHQAREYKLIIENANGELNLHHYSVTYDADGGAFGDGDKIKKENLASGASVKATENVPVLDGYVFAGWEYDGKVISAGSEVIASLNKPITLKAKWEKEVNVTINVTIDHKVDGGYDYNDDRDELTLSFLEQTEGSPAFIETGDKLYFSKNGIIDQKGNGKAYEYLADIQGEAVLETRYTALAPTYEGLLESSYFGVAVSKSGYDVGVIEKIKDENGNWTINVPLTYNPDDFDLEFSVEMADDVPSELYPDAVIVKIACWDPDVREWVIITQQRTTENTVRPGVRVNIDPVTGEGKGSYPVWKFDSELNPYGYRAVVTGFIYDNSTIVVPAEKNYVKGDDEVIITYTDGNYTATMGDISDGKKYSTSLYGAYYSNAANKQQGTLDAVISVEKYDVTFDAQGGEVNGKDADTAFQMYYIPSFDDYKPLMDGHNFLGWYLDEACTVPAKEGELLVSDVTLYAKWDRVIEGTLIVDGYYKDEKGQHIVNDADRVTHVLVELEEITNDGTYNIAGQVVEIDWTSDDHFSNAVPYRFDGLSPDKTYRIDAYVVNYEAAYQNINSEVNGNGDIHDDYYEDDYTAIYTEDGKYRYETYVNTFLHFEPEVYFQNVEVDATRIGEGFRPEKALVEYLGKESGSNKEYSTIIQHKVEPFGVEAGIGADGKNDGTYGCEIWKKIFNGNLYDYQANLTKLDGEEVDSSKMIVIYGDSVRWSPYSQAPTDSLKVTLIPMWYDIVYMWNDGTDYSETVSRGHTWSHESAVDKEGPQRVGYNFVGWYSNPDCTGEPVTKIDASVAHNTTVYAKWEQIKDYSLTVNYVDKNNTENVLKTVVMEDQGYGDEVKAESFIEEFTGYKYDSASADSIKIDVDSAKNLITLYYVAKTYGYTVKYLEKDTGKVLADEKKGSAVFGSEVTETAVNVKGYSVAHELSKTVTIHDGENIITFYYVPDCYGYTVNYLEKGTNRPVADAKYEEAEYGKEITETARVIKGYTLDGEESKSITVDTENNVINFYYEINSYGYTVNYLENGTDKALSEPVNGNAEYGKEVTGKAKAIKGYSLVGEDSRSIVIDTENNVINFYYEADFYGYTVNYLTKGTNKVLIGAKYDTAKYGEEITETAETIKGYTLDDDYSKSILIDTENNVINFYYTANSCKYQVVYLEEGTDNEIGSEMIQQAYFSDTVTVKSKAIDGYVLVDVSSKTVVIDEEMKVIPFYYAVDKVGNDDVYGDNIPDKYQKKVIYRVINGTWSNGKTTDIVEYVSLLKDGKYDENGSGSLKRIPTGMKALDGFADGSWKVTPPSAVSGTKEEIFEFVFKEIVKPPVVPEDPENPDNPTPDAPGGDGEGGNGGAGGNGSVNTDSKHHIVFGKTDGIGWYRVSKDGGQTWDIVFGNSTYEVEHGSELIIKAGDLMGDSFTFYVNGDAVKPNDDGEIRVTVKGYMLIGAIGIDPDIDFQVPDTEESLNWFQKIIKAIKDFFNWLFGKK